jgi:hypothetical protein
LDDRPRSDSDIPPIPLLYDGFGHFLDFMDGRRDDIPGLADVDIQELHKTVDDLAVKMTGYFSTEDDRRDAALPCLNRIFAARRGTQIPPLSAAAIGSVTDGHNTGLHGASMLVAELRNWVTGINSIPEVEMVGYVAHKNRTEMNDEASRQLFLQWRVPCVGLTIVGELDVIA